MRAFAWLLAALLAAGLIGASIAYPAFELASHLGPWPFHRVSGRIAMLLLALELVWLCRHLKVDNKRDCGFGLGWRRFLAGLAGMGCASASPRRLWVRVSCWATGLRVVTDPASLGSAATVSHLLLAGLASGISVALIEETVFRGAMHTAIARESSPWSAALLTAPLFAILHFYAKASIPPEQLGYGSGFDLLLRSFAPLGHPALVIDSFFAWLAVGLLLSLTRVLTGNIAVAVGLHAGWVVVLRMLQMSTTRGEAARVFRVGRAVRWFAGLLAAAVGRRHRSGAVVDATRLGTLCQRRELVQAPDGVVELQIILLVGERDRQNFRQPVADPCGIVEPHVDIRVHLAQLRQNRAQAAPPGARDAPAPARRVRRPAIAPRRGAGHPAVGCGHGCGSAADPRRRARASRPAIDGSR